MRIEPRPHWPQDVRYIQMKKQHSVFFCFADEKRERIYLGKTWRDSPDIDAFVFHEYRHILHRRENLFADYYASLWAVKERILKDPAEWLRFALEAETDCDNYALEKTGMDLGEYPLYGVAHFALADKLMKREQKK